MPDHCMHPPNWTITNRDPDYRACCWCDFKQAREYAGPPLHGPNFKGESREWHWTPSSLHACPKRPPQ